jgi:pimeloyl-ACP methyl ester carboxylesterase
LSFERSGKLVLSEGPMNHARAATLALLLAVAPCLQAQDEPKKPDAKGVEGLWLGTLNTPSGVRLRLILKVSKKEGGLAGTFKSIDQGANEIPCDDVTFADGKLAWKIKSLGASFKGTLDDDGDVAGTFVQGGAKRPLTFSRVEKEPEVKRPQDPVRPFPYEEEEVTVENVTANVKLAGTFTHPKEGGPFPAVFLITGSGPQDRDEALMGHRPFLVLSDHFTRKGIAVLRVDDRGTAKSTGNFAGATTEDFAGDAQACLDHLKGRKDVDPARIGLVGHSEGGLIAPLLASRTKDVAFVVMLAGPGLPGDEIILRQSALIGKASGATDEEIAQASERQKKILAVAKKQAPREDLEKELRGLLPPGAKTDQVLSPWYRFFLAYDPRPALRSVHCPVLALNGEKDLQVPPDEDLTEIEKALGEAKNKDVTTKKLPGLNHLFQTCKTGTPAEYATIEETMAPAALEAISSWILERTKK